MLSLDIQKFKEEIREKGFQRYIVGTAACMKRIMKATKGCGQLSYKDTLFSDRWFRVVKAYEE